MEKITHGVLESPGFPNTFKTNLDKKYTIQVTKEKVVNLGFSEFNLDNVEPCQDYVKIVDNNTRELLPPSCGKKLISDILSHTNRVNIFFHSDNLRSIQTMARWRLTWEESKQIS